VVAAPLSAAAPRFLRVALDLPFAPWFDYAIDPAQAEPPAVGDWLRVPWGNGERIGLVLALAQDSDLAPERIRMAGERLAELPPAPPAWLALLRFAADYYHCGAGELALPALPRLFRTPPRAGARGSPVARARKRWQPVAAVALASAPATPTVPTTPPGEATMQPSAAPPLSEAQHRAVSTLRGQRGFAAFLLHGVTGSGKTEVYLHWLADVLAADPAAQVLLMVPEIALTPQLAAQLAARFPHEGLAVLHSALPDGERAGHWLAAAEGRARIVVGTRLAVLAPLPALAAIVVDEEHDPSYRQQEGVRYSARDLAVAAAAQRDIPVLLGSATPSLESWLSARRRRYTLLELPGRISDAPLPAVELLDLRGKTLNYALAPAAIQAIADTVARGEQALIFVNRRGYAPVLHCGQCGWLSRCDDCSALRVLHRLGAAGARGPAPRGPAPRGPAPRGPAPRGPARYRLACHHCGGERAVPRSCPDCGNVDLKGLGQGTQRLEEGLAELFPGARIARLDRDVARRRGAAQAVLDAAHTGEVDILVGTQMLAKGHDFRRLSLVLVPDCDGGLYAADYRAPERLFATLMQVAGRAGRDARASRVILQTRFPEHPLFAHLARHDYPGFADEQLAERHAVGLPPWRFQALLRAEARTQAQALAFLAEARALGQALNPGLEQGHGQEQRPSRAMAGERPAGEVPPALVLLDPVPMTMSRLAGRERAQLLVEADTRSALHGFVARWLDALRGLRTTVRWQLDIDPAEI